MVSKRTVYCLIAVLVLAIFAPGLAAAAEKLTFVPVTPCRAVDTRCIPPAQAAVTCPNAIVPGAGSGDDINASSTRPFTMVGAGDMRGQGGGALGCGVPGYDVVTGDPIAKAVAINVTAISPNNKGNLRAWNSDPTPPEVSNINFSTNVNIANSAVVTLAQDLTEGDDISVLSGGPVTSVHMAIDIVGYYIGDVLLAPAP